MSIAKTDDALIARCRQLPAAVVHGLSQRDAD
jgi:hypothetical protein